MDLVADGGAYGRRFRRLTIVDDYARKCLAIEGNKPLPDLHMATVQQQRLAETRRRIRFFRPASKKHQCYYDPY